MSSTISDKKKKKEREMTWTDFFFKKMNKTIILKLATFFKKYILNASEYIE